MTTLSDGLQVFSSPLPASGPILIFILNLLDGIVGSDPKLNLLATAEAFKYAYGVRCGLGDSENPDVLLVNTHTHMKTIKLM